MDDQLTLEQFRDELSRLLGRARKIEKSDVADELHLQLDCLRDEIEDEKES